MLKWLQRLQPFLTSTTPNTNISISKRLFIIAKQPVMKTHIQSVKTSKSEKRNGSQSNELKTDSPLSEKDEFKKAENRTRKALKHHL
jgi:hypothetical protein